MDAPDQTITRARFGLTRESGVGSPSLQRLPERPFWTLPGRILRKFLPGKVSMGCATRGITSVTFAHRPGMVLMPD